LFSGKFQAFSTGTRKGELLHGDASAFRTLFALSAHSVQLPMVDAAFTDLAHFRHGRQFGFAEKGG